MDTFTPKKAKTLSWSSFGISDTGKVRKHNEDALLERPEIGLWVVADGMGGHAAGDVASQMIVSSLKKVHEGIELNRMVNDIEDRLIEVNKRLIEKANQSAKRTTIGSTIVVMVAYQKYCRRLRQEPMKQAAFGAKMGKKLERRRNSVGRYVYQGINLKGGGVRIRVNLDED